MVLFCFFQCVIIYYAIKLSVIVLIIKLLKNAFNKLKNDCATNTRKFSNELDVWYKQDISIGTTGIQIACNTSGNGTFSTLLQVVNDCEMP